MLLAWHLMLLVSYVMVMPSYINIYTGDVNGSGDVEIHVGASVLFVLEQ